MGGDKSGTHSRILAVWMLRTKAIVLPTAATFRDRQDRLTTVSRMKSLQLQEAKQQFSAVAEKAARGQPQIVTKHGKPFVVIVSVADWQNGRPKKRTLIEMLRSCPVDLTELDLTRRKELPRDIAL